MQNKRNIAKVSDVIIQIATPNSTGTGFYLKQYDLIVTNEHVIRSDKSVVINNPHFESQLVEVLFIDEKYDIALLSANDVGKYLQEVTINDVAIQLGEEVIAMGHPFGMQFSSTSGIISNQEHHIDDIHYVQHDATLNPGNSGGPLVGLTGNVVGVNTFLNAKGVSLAYALPSSILIEIIEQYLPIRGTIAQRCPSCQFMIKEADLSSNYCMKCGTQISPISKWQAHIPAGIDKTIEDMLSDQGFDVRLSRRGPAQWYVERGSAGIKISYHEKSGLIEGDAYLVQLPDDNIDQLYKFLLQQNYEMDGLTFSVKSNHVVLSLLVYDQYFDHVVSSKLFKKLYETADHFDDVLVNDFQAKWNK